MDCYIYTKFGWGENGFDCGCGGHCNCDKLTTPLLFIWYNGVTTDDDVVLDWFVFLLFVRTALVKLFIFVVLFGDE